MPSFFVNLAVVRKLVLVVFFTISTVFTLLTGFLYQRTSASILELAEKELVQQLSLLTATFEVFDQNITKATESLSNVFVAMFPEGLELDSSETVRIGAYDSPVIRHAGKSINLDFAKPDEFTHITGGNATVFVRNGDDFLRVSTSLKKGNGERATGTLLGKGHPGYQTLLGGNPYLGKARLFGRDYMTKYQPVKAADGQVIAILYVGFDFTEVLAGLKERMSQITVGDSGLVFLADISSGKDNGTLIVHRNKAGGNLLDETDLDGKAVFHTAFEQPEGVLSYQALDETGQAVTRIAVFKRIDNWKFVMGINAVRSEITALSWQLSQEMIALMSVGAIVIVLMLFFMLRAELAPLKRVARFLKRVGQGDLSEFLSARSDNLQSGVRGSTDNEIRQLESSVDDMVREFRVLLTGIHDIAEPLSQEGSKLAELTETTHRHLRDQQDRTDQVAAATTEMTASIQEVAGSVSAAATSTQQANSQAGEGHATVSQVEQSVKLVAENMEQAADVIGRLKQESENIGVVLDVIRGIAEQTNLLALNAAIEAARAGEQGRGFAVVADEVRSLAQRTQQSTQEIQGMIERLQAEASTAVAQMVSSHQSSHKSVEQAMSAATVLVAIEHTAAEISGMITQVASAAEEQSVVAEEINGNVVGIRDLSESTATQASQTAEAGEHMAHLVTRLTANVERFKL